MARFVFYSPIAFESWDWRNSIEQGIGGSETSHVEMAWRLARRGHEVITYAPIPDDCPGEWRGTTWKRIEDADFSQSGVWVLYRCPEAIDRFSTQPDQQLWFLMQDWDYPSWTTERKAKLDRVITLCQWHGRYVLDRHPDLAGKLWLTSNGIKLDLMEQIDQEPITRDSHTIVFASSPDRGLLHVIESVARAREWVPDLTLHATYGFNNLDKIPSLRADADRIKAALDQPWITFHGRLTQPDLYRLWRRAGLWVYRTNFHETSCITSMEAQALGAIPIVSPVAALAENVRHGTHVPGMAGEPLTKVRFSAEIVRLSDPVLQQQIRLPMMADARGRFDWERFVDQWEAAATGQSYLHDFPIQLSDGWTDAVELVSC
jgi:glycosyltransferase involved in cell wall biosynthesis